MSGERQGTWEYRAEPTPGLDRLNELGAEGWELIGIDAGAFYLKRPALSFKDRVAMEQRAHYFANRNAQSHRETDR